MNRVGIKRRASDKFRLYFNVVVFAVLGIALSACGGPRSGLFIAGFTAANTTITTGDDATLTASFTGGVGSLTSTYGGVTTDLGNVTSDTPTIIPTPQPGTTVYTLTVTNGDETVTKSVSLTVVAPPTITDLIVSSPIITLGTTTQITPIFADGTATITSSDGAAPILLNASASGNPVVVTPQVLGTVTYTLTVTNAAGATATLTGDVTAVAAGTITSFTAADPIITFGGSTSLTAIYTGSSGQITANDGSAPISITSGNSVTVTPQNLGITTYTLTVDNGLGGTDSRQLNVSTVPIPNITGFSAAATTVTSGASTTLTAVFDNANGETATVDYDGAGPAVPVAIYSGVPLDTGALTANRTYTLTVTNAVGYAVVYPTTVTVAIAQAPTAALVSNDADNNITVGDAITLTPTFTNAATAVITDNQGGAPIDAVALGSGNATGTLNPSVTTIYTLTVTNAAGTVTTATVTVNVFGVPTAGLVSDDADNTITAGDPITLTPTFTNAATAVITDNQGGAPIDAAALGSGNATGTLNPSVTTIYTLTVTNGAGATATAQVTVTVLGGPTAALISSDADNTITVGDAINLTPTFTNAATAVISNNQDATTIDAFALGSGNATANLNPSATTIYTLTVTNAAGTVASANVTITVLAAPTAGLVSSDADNLISSGDPITLTPTFTNATSAVITDNQGGAPINLDPVSGSGVPTATLNPTVGTTYILTVTNGAGATATANVTVNVLGGPTANLVSSDTDNIISAGDPITLTPTFTNATSAVITDNQGGTPINLDVATGSGVPTGTLNPSVTTTYILTVTNGAGTVATDNVTVTVAGVPTASLVSNDADNNITVGDAITLTPTFTNAATAVITDNQGGTPINLNAVSGSGVATGALTPGVTTIYTLTVTNAAGAVATTNLTVNVFGVPTAASLVSNDADNTITAGDPITLTPTFTNAATAVISNDVDATTIDAAALGSGNASGTLNPNVTTIYTLTVTNGAGVQATTTVTITVFGVPTASLASSDADNNITVGDNITLTPTFTNAATAVITDDQGGTPIDAAALGSGNPTGTLSPSVTTVYTLTVTNAVGVSATSTVTINVFGVPTAPSLVSNDADNIITSGDPITLTPTFTNEATAVITDDQGGTPIDAAALGSGNPTGTLNPTATTIYTLTVTNGAGVQATTTVTITVLGAPTAGLVSSATTIGQGSSITLTPTFTNAATAVISNDQDATTIDAVALGSGNATGPLTPIVTTVYTLTVTSGAGSVQTATATITVVPAAVLGVTYDIKQLQFSWADTGADHYKLWEDPDGVSGYSQVGSNLAAGTTNYAHNVAVHLRGNAKYLLQSCDAADTCADSNTVDVTGAIVAAIGYIKGSPTSSDQLGYNVAVSGDGNTIAAATIYNSTNTGKVYVFSNRSGVWAQEQVLTASNAAQGAWFGYGLALSTDGATLAVGAASEDTTANNSGAAYIFTRSGTSWTQFPTVIKAANPEVGALFGRDLALSPDGLVLAVAAPDEDSANLGPTPQVSDCLAAATAGDANLSPGTITIANGTSTNLSVTFPTITDTGSIEGSDGSSIPVTNPGDGSTVPVAVTPPINSVTTYTLWINGSATASTSTVTTAPAATNCAVNSGAVFVFTQASGWAQQAYIKSPNVTAAGSGNHGFGYQVALNGTGSVLAVGSPQENGLGGRAYLYSGTGWGSVTTINNPGTGSANFGSAVSLDGSGTILAVGAQFDNGNGTESGAAYVYTSANWGTPQATVTGSYVETTDWYGSDIALSYDGSTLAVACKNENGDGVGINPAHNNNLYPASGAVYVFTNSGGTWPEKAYVKASNTVAGDLFGRNLSISADGSALVAGAIYEDGNATGAVGGVGGNQVHDSDCSPSATNCKLDSGAVYLY